MSAIVRFMRKAVWGSATASALALLATASPAQSQSAGDYQIGPQDVLTIQVFDQADLGGKYTVETDGTFSFPLIGRVKAAGMTLRAFEVELKAKLADGYFRNLLPGRALPEEGAARDPAQDDGEGDRRGVLGGERRAGCQDRLLPDEGRP
jgi:protein involved in polysaccharide export with SLBB domain